MDMDNLNQNLNTRVVFKEPRGMIRWVQILFALIAFSTVVDFHTTIGVTIKCPQPTPANNTNTTLAPPTNVDVTPKLIINYPFDFGDQIVSNGCPGYNFTYQHHSPLEASPQFFVMTAVLALVYAAGSLILYLLFSSTYASIPVVPVADLIITGLLCILWLIASSSFSSGVTVLKSTVNYNNIKQTICPNQFLQVPGVSCNPSLDDQPSWKALNVALVSGFTSCFLWGSGMWFVFKETHFHSGHPGL